jgi:hypothetical protein
MRFNLPRSNCVAFGTNRTSTSAVVGVASTVLRIKRTLDGAEIDTIIADVQARNAMAIEQRRWARLG